MTEPIEELLRDIGDLPAYPEGGQLDLKKRLKLAAFLLEKIPESVGAEMVLVQAESPHQIFQLTESSLEFGRDSLETSDPGLSRRHFLIEQKEGQAWISDCSRNGTWVNGARLSEPAILCDGDLVQASTSVLLFTRLTPDHPG